MAGTGENASGTPEYNAQTQQASGDKRLAPWEFGGLNMARTVLTVDANSGTGTGGALQLNDEVNLIQLPANARLIADLCKIFLSATQAGTAPTQLLGFRAYNNVDGTAVAEDPNGLLDAWDATTVVIEDWFTSGTAGAGLDNLRTRHFDSRAPVTIMMKAGGTAYDGDLGDTLEYTIFFMMPSR